MRRGLDVCRRAGIEIRFAVKRFIVEFRGVLKREWTLEMRNRSGAWSVLLYSALTVLVSGLAFREPLSPEAWSAFFGVILLFVAMTTVAKSFSDETPERLRLVYQYCSPEAFVAGKMFYNAVFMAFSSLLTLALYLVFMRDPGVHRGYAFLGMFLGGAGLGTSLTLLSAVAAAAGRISTLLAVLGFPLLIPQLNAVVRLLFGAYQEVWKWGDVYLIAGITALSAALSVVLYPYIWQE